MLSEIKGFGGIYDLFIAFSTVHKEISDVHNDISQVIAIKDTLPKIIKINPKTDSVPGKCSIKVRYNIEQIPVRISDGVFA
jgi:hypothetical protein